MTKGLLFVSLGLAACATAGEGHPAPPPPGAALDAACTPAVVFENLDAEADGQLFQTTLGDPAPLMQEASRRICRLLYHQAAEVPQRPTVKLVVEKKRGIAYSSHGEIHASSGYFAHYTRGDVRQEILGVLHHELTHLWQSGGKSWVIEGIADYVRFRTGYFPVTNRHPGGRYDSSYQVTGFFFDWLETRSPGFVYRLNQRLRQERFSDAWFAELTGTPVEPLWAEYQASLSPPAQASVSP
jgi:hypothetical protein